MLPIALALGSQLGSVYLRNRAESTLRRRRNALTADEMVRQRRFGAEAEGSLDDQIAKMSMPAEELRMDAERARYENAVMPTIGGDMTFTGVGQADAPAQVKGEIARQIHTALVAGRDQAKRSARMNARNRVTQDRQTIIQRGADDLNRIGNFASGSASVLPYEYDAAEQGVQRMRQMSDLAGSVGNALLMYGLTRPPAGASASPFANRGSGNFGHGGGQYDPNLWRMSDDFAG